MLRPGTDNFVFQGQRGDLVEIESVKHHFLSPRKREKLLPTHFPQLMRTQFPRRRLEQLDVNLQAFVPEFQSLLSRVLWGYQAKRSVQSQF